MSSPSLIDLGKYWELQYTSSTALRNAQCKDYIKHIHSAVDESDHERTTNSAFVGFIKPIGDFQSSLLQSHRVSLLIAQEIYLGSINPLPGRPTFQDTTFHRQMKEWAKDVRDVEKQIMELQVKCRDRSRYLKKAKFSKRKLDELETMLDQEENVDQLSARTSKISSTWGVLRPDIGVCLKFMAKGKSYSVVLAAAEGKGPPFSALTQKVFFGDQYPLEIDDEKHQRHVWKSQGKKTSEGLSQLCSYCEAVKEMFGTKIGLLLINTKVSRLLVLEDFLFALEVPGSKSSSRRSVPLSDFLARDDLYDYIAHDMLEITGHPLTATVNPSTAEIVHQWTLSSLAGTLKCQLDPSDPQSIADSLSTMTERSSTSPFTAGIKLDYASEEIRKSWAATLRPIIGKSNALKSQLADVVEEFDNLTAVARYLVENKEDETDQAHPDDQDPDHDRETGTLRLRGGMADLNQSEEYEGNESDDLERQSDPDTTPSPQSVEGPQTPWVTPLHPRDTPANLATPSSHPMDGSTPYHIYDSSVETTRNPGSRQGHRAQNDIGLWLADIKEDRDDSKESHESNELPESQAPKLDDDDEQYDFDEIEYSDERNPIALSLDEDTHFTHDELKRFWAIRGAQIVLVNEEEMDRLMRNETL